MNEDQENPDSDCDSQISSKDHSYEDINPSRKEDSSLELEQSAESKNEQPPHEDSATKKKSYNKKAWLFLLFLIITIGAGGYFYFQKKGIDLSITLPSDLNKSLLFTEKTPKVLATQSKTAPIESAPKVIEQVEAPSTIEKPSSEDEKMIKLLRDEVRSLKIELTQKNSIPSPQNIQNVMPHISGRVVREKTEASTGEKEEKPEPEMEVALIPPLPVKTNSSVSRKTLEGKTKELIEKEQAKPKPDLQASLTLSPPVKTEPSRLQKTSPLRSKEVQAYLDFVENTGSKLAQLVREWLSRLLALVPKY
jgi:hypothetical protein